MLINNIAPRHFSPDGVHHMNADVKFTGDFFSRRARFNFVSDLPYLIGRQFLSVLKHGNRMPGILARGHVFKVGHRIISLVAVFVVNVIPVWARAYKGFGDHAVNGSMKMLVVYGQRYKIISVSSKRWLKCARRIFIRRPSQDFADDGRANTKYRRHFSGAHPFSRQPAHFFYVNLVKSALRKIPRSQTAYLPRITYFVCVLKTAYPAPPLHLQTPIS